jgi:hypothetical protein
MNKITIRVPKLYDISECEKILNDIVNHIFNAETEIDEVLSSLTESNFLSLDISKIKVFGKDSFLKDYAKKSDYDELIIRIKDLENKIRDGV